MSAMATSRGGIRGQMFGHVDNKLAMLRLSCVCSRRNAGLQAQAEKSNRRPQILGVGPAARGRQWTFSASLCSLSVSLAGA